ncbi:MAG: UvrD-helicase domain-containing protein [Gammaproteobacteria bacterium]|nr:UvrD-helicase domain-containing protein [Gammaproteobacteria bacterium]
MNNLAHNFFMSHISDQALRDNCLDITKSFIVQAAAGSGKTTLLVNRYFNLLLKHIDNPEEILAITFTKKAASEMQHRVLEKLKIEQNENLKIKKILLNPNQLCIQTIDSFSYNLANNTSLTSKSENLRNLLPEGSVKATYHEAAFQLIKTLKEKTRYQSSLKNLLFHLDNNYERLESLIAKMLAKREQWLPYIINSDLKKEKLRNLMEKSLQEIIKNNINHCEQLFDRNDILELQHLTNFANQTSTSSWQSIANLCLNKSGSIRKTVNAKNGFPSPSSSKNKEEQELFLSMKTRMLSMLTKLAKNKAFVDALIHIKNSPPSKYSEEEWRLIIHLIEMLKNAAAYLNITFQDKNGVDYNAIAMEALNSLSEYNPSELALSLDYKLKHILVDEFQDTSVIQYQLLEKLTSNWLPEDEHTLFLVGDPMQSIYKFREAKVGLFLRAKEQGISNIKLNYVALTSNFRSSSKLVDWFNEVFSKIMPKNDDVYTGAISYKSACGIKQYSAKIACYGIDEEDHSSEALQVIEILNEIYNENPNASVAILARYRNHLDETIRELRNNGIYYQAVSIDKLTKNHLIQDLVALTKSIIDPTDRTSWLALLRGPCCNIKLDDLLKIASLDAQETILNILQQPELLLKLSEKSQITIKKTSQILQKAILFPRFTSVATIVKQAWEALDGKDKLASKTEALIAHNYFQLLLKLEENATIDLTKLLDNLENLYADAEPAKDQPKTVQLMTIHKAKGLEFDHVIIPGLNHAPRSDENALLQWTEAPFLLSAIPNKSGNNKEIYTYLKFLRNEQLHNELTRLLYVAITRAKKGVHLLATDYKNPQKGSLLKELTPVWSAYLTPITSTPTSKPKNRTPLPTNHPAKTKSSFQQTIITKPLSTPKNNGAGKKQCNEEIDHTSRNIGIIIHKILAELSKNTDLQLSWNVNKRWRNELIQLGNYIDLNEQLQFIEKTINRALKDKRGRWILNSKHKASYSEYQLSRANNNNLIIDRTFVDKDICWIVDYKTAPMRTVDSQKYLTENLSNYKKQLFAYKKAMQNTTNYPIKTGVYIPQFALWHEFS